ncbi:MAG: nuclear transport factor 2 family protein [Sphingomicrobium sp.]
MRIALLSAIAACAVLGACEKAATPAANSVDATAINEADAEKLADNMVASWQSQDAARIKALYSSDVVAFDYASPALTTDRAAFDKNQDAFAANKIDKITQVERKIQIPDADDFIVSGAWDDHSAIPANNGRFRCTDVFHKQVDGKWLIINEHCSAVPKAAV